MAETLFDDHDVDRPDPAARRAVRRAVLGWVLRSTRTRNNQTVNEAAAGAGIAPMTWRRLEQGLDVRRRSYTAVDGVLGVPFGTVATALDDDLRMADLAAHGGAGTSVVDPDEVAAFLDGLAERAHTGSVAHVQVHAGVATGRGAAGPLRAAVGQAIGSAMPRSDMLRAAELVDHITRRATTPALQRAVDALLAAMPDLARPRTDDDEAAQ